MNNIPINFFKEDISFRLSHKDALKKWIVELIKEKNFKLININYIFCSDRYLLKMNKNYLRHHYYTDIITFNNSTKKKNLEADIFISYERVKINAANYRTSLNNELHRVMIHGVLHLLGFKDKSEKEKKLMREKEDELLQHLFL